MSNHNTTTSSQKKKQANISLNLVLNIVLPSLLMIKGHVWFGLSSASSLAIALAFPIGYGIYDFLIRRKYNVISIVGFVSILMTGGIGLLQLPKEWVAIKEASFPLLLGLMVIVSLKTPYPLVRTFFYNNELVDTQKIDQALESKGTKKDFNQLLVQSTYIISLLFFLSAVLNFFLAKHFIQSETGTQAFIEELGKLTAWSYPIIAIPYIILIAVALFKFIAGIKRLTGLNIETVFRMPQKESK